MEKPKFKGLALPPPSAAIGYRKTQKPTNSTGGLALPPPSATLDTVRIKTLYNQLAMIWLHLSRLVTIRVGKQPIRMQDH
jgi:hypothetical protein